MPVVFCADSHRNLLLMNFNSHTLLLLCLLPPAKDNFDYTFWWVKVKAERAGIDLKSSFFVGVKSEELTKKSAKKQKSYKIHFSR
jgi:hypothetical protein